MMKHTLLALTLVAVVGCGRTQVVVTPQAPTTVDYVMFAIGSLQMVADTGCHATPQTISTKACMAVDTYAPQVMADIKAAGSGWKAAAQSALSQIQADLPAADYQPIAPYVIVAQAALAAVPAN